MRRKGRKKDRKKKRIRFFRSAFLTILTLFSLFQLSRGFAQAPEHPHIVNMRLDWTGDRNAVPPKLAVGEAMRVEGTGLLIDLSNVKSEAVLLKELATGKTLVRKNETKRIFPASLTKIMTTILAIEMVADLDQKIVMKEEYFQGLFELDASIAGFQEKEEIKFRDLLYGAMLPSGADACRAIAILLAGSEEAYVELMNERAAQLGMDRTHFQNVTGLHHPDNYSTASDLATLLTHALKNPVFYEVFTTPHYQTDPTNLNEGGVLMSHTLTRYVWEYPSLTDTIVGSKTGFTEEAGQCLASIAQIDGTFYILVTTGAGADPLGLRPGYVAPTQPMHLQDAVLIYGQLKRQTETVEEKTEVPSS